MNAEELEKEIRRIHDEHARRIRRLCWRGLVRGVLAAGVGSLVGIALTQGPTWLAVCAGAMSLAWVASTMWSLRPRRCDICRNWTQLPPDDGGTILCDEHWIARIWQMFGDTVIQQLKPREPGAPETPS